MKMWKVLLPVTAVLLFSGTAVAQSGENEEAQRIEAEAKREEMESNRAEYSEHFGKPRNAWNRRHEKSPKLRANDCRSGSL